MPMGNKMPGALKPKPVKALTVSTMKSAYLKDASNPRLTTKELMTPKRAKVFLSLKWSINRPFKKSQTEEMISKLTQIGSPHA